jgi:hypothetical protein
VTEDGRFCTSNEGEVRSWQTADPVAFRDELVDALGLRGQSADDHHLARKIFLLDAENAHLYSPRDSIHEASLEDLTAFELSSQTEPVNSWEDWWRVQTLMADLLLQAWRRGEDLAFVAEGDPCEAVTCLMGHGKSGRALIQIHSPWRVGHEVWERATARDGQFVLEAPLNEEMVRAAADLVKLALRDRAHSPADVFPTFICS